MITLPIFPEGRDMTPVRLPSCPLAPVLLVCWLTAMVGCQPFDRYQPFDHYDQSLDRPVAAYGLAPLDEMSGGSGLSPAVASMTPPRELAMVSLPAYRIEPPDELWIEVPKLVPLPPYRLQIGDVLKFDVRGTLRGQPIAPYEEFVDELGQVQMAPTADGGLRQIDPNGEILLGRDYGSLRVLGMTVEEVHQLVDTHLRRLLAQPDVVVELYQMSGHPPISGPHLVTMDGTVNLLGYGPVHVAGKSLPEARAAIEAFLSQFLDSPQVQLDVQTYNSKVYYVITAGAGLGDNVARFPITGNETVLDAISQIQGLSQMSSKEIWIARPSPGGFGCRQILPVDWTAITRGAATDTNYQVLPGDRIFIAEDSNVALANFIDKVTRPIEELFGFVSLGSSTIRSINNVNTRTGGGGY